MPNFSIDNFWSRRLPPLGAVEMRSLAGWNSEPAPLPTFMEAPLNESAGFGTGVAPDSSSTILVSAPGAVGKSTLARQIAALTGAVYVDLSKSDPVGGNTLSGGLVKAGLYAQWEAGSTTVLLDGLDEARLRVTQEAFESFLNDVADLAQGREIPTVLFGRTGAVQDSWLILEDRLPITVLEIGYYGPTAAADFAFTRLRAAKPDSPHLDPARRAIELLLQGLRSDTSSDGDRFAGYAPVLQAVADRVAQEGNPSALIAQIEGGEQPVTLRAVVDAILRREHQKLSSLGLENPGLLGVLYTPAEQLMRLAAHVYRQPQPEAIIDLSPKDAATYDAALKNWLPEHPFLDGGQRAASAVFGGMITAQALRSPFTADVALKTELANAAAANPFLAEFYLNDEQETYLPPEHIGVVYASLRARLALGDTASLSVEGADDAEGEEALRADVEISVSRVNSDTSKTLSFESEQTGVIRLGNHVEDIEIFAPHTSVEIGAGEETILVAPVAVQCEELRFSTARLIIEAAPGNEANGVHLEAEAARVDSVVDVPILHGGAALSVAWSGARAHPWTSFAVSPAQVQNPKLDEGLRRFRKFVISFRSHSKGSLKRYRHKIEHARMTKGTGRAVLDRMISEGILTLDGDMYTLHPDVLASKADASYVRSVARDFSATTIGFVGDAIEGLG